MTGAIPRLDQCDPNQLAWLVKEVGQLDRKHNTFLDLAPIAAEGGDRGKVDEGGLLPI